MKSYMELQEAVKGKHIDKEVIDGLIELNEVPSVGTQVALVDMLYNIGSQLASNGDIQVDDIGNLKEFHEWLEDNFTTHVVMEYERKMMRGGFDVK